MKIAGVDVDFGKKKEPILQGDVGKTGGDFDSGFICALTAITAVDQRDQQGRIDVVSLMICAIGRGLLGMKWCAERPKVTLIPLMLGQFSVVMVLKRYDFEYLNLLLAG